MGFTESFRKIKKYGKVVLLDGFGMQLEIFIDPRHIKTVCGRKVAMVRRKEEFTTMTFVNVWKEVRGLLEEALKQVQGSLSGTIKRKLSRKRVNEIERIVIEAIDEVNRGSIVALDELRKKRL